MPNSTFIYLINSTENPSNQVIDIENLFLNELSLLEKSLNKLELGPSESSIKRILEYLKH